MTSSYVRSLFWGLSSLFTAPYFVQTYFSLEADKMITMDGFWLWVLLPSVQRGANSTTTMPSTAIGNYISAAITPWHGEGRKDYFNFWSTPKLQIMNTAISNFFNHTKNNKIFFRWFIIGPIKEVLVPGICFSGRFLHFCSSLDVVFDSCDE